MNTMIVSSGKYLFESAEELVLNPTVSCEDLINIFSYVITKYESQYHEEPKVAIMHPRTFNRLVYPVYQKHMEYIERDIRTNDFVIYGLYVVKEIEAPEDQILFTPVDRCGTDSFTSVDPHIIKVILTTDLSE